MKNNQTKKRVLFSIFIVILIGGGFLAFQFLKGDPFDSWSRKSPEERGFSLTAQSKEGYCLYEKKTEDTSYWEIYDDENLFKPVYSSQTVYKDSSRPKRRFLTFVNEYYYLYLTSCGVEEGDKGAVIRASSFREEGEADRFGENAIAVMPEDDVSFYPEIERVVLEGSNINLEFRYHISETVLSDTTVKYSFDTDSSEYLELIAVTDPGRVYVNEMKLWSEQNAFFFEPGTTSAEFKFSYSGSSEAEQMPEKADMQIETIAEWENGTVYRMKWNLDEEIEDESLKYRAWLGYFYVTRDRIYRILGEEHIVPEAEETFLKEGVIVMDQRAITDPNPDENGVRYDIQMDGDICRCGSYSTLVETGYYETFVWKKGTGLVGYQSGWGAERDAVKLYREGFVF